MNIKLHRQNSLTTLILLEGLCLQWKIEKSDNFDEKQIIYIFLTELFDKKVTFLYAKQRMQNGNANSNVW